MSSLGSLFGNYQTLFNNGVGITSIVGTANQVAANGYYTASQTGDVVLSLPQDIAVGSSPTFAGAKIGSGTGVATFTSGVMGTGSVSNPLTYTGGALGFGYNTTNLKLTASQLDTIQGISTTASPTFAGITTSKQAILYGSTGSTGYLANASVFIGGALATTSSNAIYAGIMAQPYFSTIAGQTGMTTYGMLLYPNLNSNAGTIAQHYGLYIDGFSAGTGAITHAFGAYIRAPRGLTAATTNIALYTESIQCSAFATGNKLATGSAVFDKIRVGSTTPPTNALDITGAATISGNLTVSNVASGMVKSVSGVLTLASNTSDYQAFIAAGTTAQYYKGDKTWATLNQAAVAGLTTADSPAFTGLTVNGNAKTTGTTTLAATLTGMLKATAGVVSQAVAGTDYNAPITLPLTVANGGTGFSSFLAGDILVAATSSTIGTVHGATAGSVLISQGTTSPPIYSNIPTLSGTSAGLIMSGVDTADNTNGGIALKLSGTLQAGIANAPLYVSNTATIKTNGGAPAVIGALEYINGTFSATGGICYYTTAAQLYVGAGARLTAAGSTGGNAATNAYGGYFKLPAAGTGDNRVAVYADNLYVGQAADNSNTVGVMKVSGAATIGGTLNTQNVSTTGTITATSTVTGSNLNLSNFTFANSLACAATTYTSTWSGLSASPACNFTLTRFGYLVTLRISYFLYPSTEVGVVPYCGLNPGGWAPGASIVVPIVANDGNSYKMCSMLINSNCTFYIYGIPYSNGINTTSGGRSFPHDCVVSWSMY